MSSISCLILVVSTSGGRGRVMLIGSKDQLRQKIFFGELSNNLDELDCLVPSILLPAEPSIHKFFGNSVYEKTVMDADSDLGGKFSDESGNFFTISPYTTKKRK